MLKGEEIMGFCKRKNIECRCISETSTCNTNNCHRKLPDISFREELMLRANDYEKNIDIQEDIENIKKNLNEYYYKRKYIISLVKVKKGPVAIGQYNEGHVSLFIPKGVAPLHYRQLFINEFSKLGFTEDYMEFYEQDYDYLYEYNIVLKW
jgi:hypothetical protein